jgi:hypothetical protein
MLFDYCALIGWWMEGTNIPRYFTIPSTLQSLYTYPRASHLTQGSAKCLWLSPGHRGLSLHSWDENLWQRIGNRCSHDVWHVSLSLSMGVSRRA